MGGRYLVTGVQLGMIMSDDIPSNTNENISMKRKEFIQKIIDEQYIKDSNNSIIEDCEKVRELFTENR